MTRWGVRSQRRLTLRRHILVSAATAGILVALLMHAFLYSLLAGLKGDDMDKAVPGALTLWGAWACSRRCGACGRMRSGGTRAAAHWP